MLGLLLSTALALPAVQPAPKPDYPLLSYVPWCLHSVIREWAITVEIMDRRETSWFLNDRRTFHTDLKSLAQRWERLADCPYLFEIERFPSRELICEGKEFNRSYSTHLNELVLWYPDHWCSINRQIGETEKLYEIWDVVADFRCDYYYITLKRMQLAKLRELIGDEDFYSGYLPPPVPVWRFHRID